MHRRFQRKFKKISKQHHHLAATRSSETLYLCTSLYLTSLESA